MERRRLLKCIVKRNVCTGKGWKERQEACFYRIFSFRDPMSSLKAYSTSCSCSHRLVYTPSLIQENPFYPPLFPTSCGNARLW